jgi:glycosyltransferase involved in cell wall biosynthesis
MKVLMLAPGHSIHSKRPLQWLLESGCEVAFLDYQDPRPACRGRYRFLRLWPPVGMGYCQAVFGAEAAARVSVWRYSLQLRLVRRIRPDVVHVHWVDDRAYACARSSLRPLVLTVWGSDVNKEFLPGADPGSRQRMGQALAAADLVFVDSADMPDKCAALAGRAVRTELLPLGIDTRRFHPGNQSATVDWRRKLEIPDGAPVFFSIRAFQEHYGHHIILEAFARAQARSGRQAVLVLKKYNTENPLGSGLSYEDALRRRAEELGVGPQLRWLEDVPDSQVPQLYALADAIVNYPVMDAFPVTFLEAAACETPVISCRLPSYAGTFAEKCFRLVDYGDVNALAAALAEFMRATSGERKKGVAEARLVVEQEFSEAVAKGRLLQCYNQLTRRNGRGS